MVGKADNPGQYQMSPDKPRVAELAMEACTGAQPRISLNKHPWSRGHLGFDFDVRD